MMKIGKERDKNKAPCRNCGYWMLPEQLLKSNVTGNCNAYTFPCWLYRVWEGTDSPTFHKEFTSKSEEKTE